MLNRLSRSPVNSEIWCTNPKYYLLVLVFCLGVFCGCSGEQVSKVNTDEFILQPGFEIEVVAAEPQLDSPVAMAFDMSGRIWVVELPGYMRDLDGQDENFPDGRIVILVDEDGDGRMDRRTIFMDSLVAPRALAFAYGGLLYTESTNLRWVPLKDGEISGDNELVDSLYVTGGNIEHQANGLLYNLDNWIYSARSNVRYKRKDGRWLREATTFRGQWGITQDNYGRLYYNDNSRALYGDYVMPNVLIENPYHRARFGVVQPSTTDNRVFPYQATAVNRGYQEGVLDDEEKLVNLTSACAPLIYRGDLFGQAYVGDAFVCAPEVNLIKHYKCEQSGARVLAEAAYDSSEFLVSRDETFRPINLYNGPDGALYVLDMRKGVIQHRAYMTNYLREKVLERGLEQVNGKGRIYRVSRADQSAKILPLFSTLSNEDIVLLLAHPSGKVRSFAQQHLVATSDASLLTHLMLVAADGSNPLGQIHALWTLEGLGLLSPERIFQLAPTSGTNDVLVQILRICSQLRQVDERLPSMYLTIELMRDEAVTLQLCNTVGKSDDKMAEGIWMDLASEYRNSELFSEALVSGLAGKRRSFMNDVRAKFAGDTLGKFLEQAYANEIAGQVKSPQLPVKPEIDDRTHGYALYQKHCVSCHGLDGRGFPKVAPSILNTQYVNGSEEQLIALVLHGMRGPIAINGEIFDEGLEMPGFKDNADLTDRDISDLLIFVRNSYSNAGWIGEAKVREVREKTKARSAPYTADELEYWNDGTSAGSGTGY